jgi:DNA-binding transcriptional LysR family regulator
LTPAGKIIYEAFKEIITRYDGLSEDLGILTNKYIQKLRLGMLYYGGEEYVYPLVKAFKYKYPKIQLTISSCQPHQIAQMLEEGSIDIGINLHSKFVSDAKYIYLPLYVERLSAIMLPNHPLSYKNCIAVNELSETLIITTKLDNEMNDHLMTLLKYHNIDTKNIIYTQQIDTVLLTMEETGGVFIGSTMLKKLTRGDLVFVNIDSSDFYIDMCLIYRAINRNTAIPKMVDCITSIHSNGQSKKTENSL